MNLRTIGLMVTLALGLLAGPFPTRVRGRSSAVPGIFFGRRDLHSSSTHSPQEARSSTRWLSRSMMGVRPTGMYFPYGC